MKRTTKYVGLDVHQAMTVATVRNQGGRVIARSVVETSDESIREFFSAMAGSVHVVFEEGTQAQWLYDLLSPRVDRVIMCDRRGEKRSGDAADDHHAFHEDAKPGDLAGQLGTRRFNSSVPVLDPDRVMRGAPACRRAQSRSGRVFGGRSACSRSCRRIRTCLLAVRAPPRRPARPR